VKWLTAVNAQDVVRGMVPALMDGAAIESGGSEVMGRD
jgi:SLT domain-containing protein